jgi:hypothetical protein
MTLIPYSEYRPDVSDYESPYSAFIQNVIPRGDGYGPVRNLASFTSALAAQCRGFFRALKTDGSVAIFAATSTKLYLLDNTTLTWSDVSQGAGSYSALPSTDNWWFVQFGNFVITGQANTTPQVYDLTSSSAFADLSGSPPQARYGSIVGRFLVLTGLVSNPYTIQWSGLNDVTNWTSGMNSSDFQPLPDGGILRGVGGGEFGNIYQDSAIRRMTFMAGSQEVFQIQRISEDIGMYSAGSLIRSNNRQFFFSTAGFQMIDASGQLTPIGKERVDRTFLADLDISNLQLFIGASDPRSSRVFWAYKSVGGTTAQFDKILCYDWALDRWAPITMSGEFISSLAQPGVTLENLDMISGSLDALVPSLDSFVVAKTTELAGFTADHKLALFGGANLEAQLHTAEFSREGLGGGQGGMFIRSFRPITDAPDVKGSILSRMRQSDIATVTAERSIDVDGNVNVRKSARFMRARLRFPAGTTWTFAKGIEPAVTGDGRRAGSGIGSFTLDKSVLGGTDVLG